MSRGKYTCGVCSSDFTEQCCNVACPVGWHCMAAKDQEFQAEYPHDPYEGALTRRYLLGIVVGEEAVSQRIRDAAGKCFAEGRDKDATLLRAYAKEIEQQAEQRRKENDKRYGKETS